MDKEAQEKIAELQRNWFGDSWSNDWHPLYGGINFVSDLSNMLSALGYRKLPKDKPPLLKPNDIEWVILLELVITSIKQGNRERAEIALGKMAIMAFEVQREVDIKWYEEG